MTDSDRFVSQAEAARHFGVSRTLISRKKRQGKLVMRGDLVDIRESGGAFGGNGKPVGQSVNTPVDGSTETFSEAQGRKETALANLRDLEYRQKLGDLVDVSEMERAWATAGQSLRDEFLSLPERIAEHLAAITDARQIRDILRGEIRTVLGNLPEQIRSGNPNQQAA